MANEEYQSLSDLVLWSLPEQLLQPLLVRLRLDHGLKENNVKRWLLSADPALKSVVSKEALQWKKGAVSAAQVVHARVHLIFYIGNTDDGVTYLPNIFRQCCQCQNIIYTSKAYFCFVFRKIW